MWNTVWLVFKLFWQWSLPNETKSCVSSFLYKRWGEPSPLLKKISKKVWITEMPLLHISFINHVFMISWLPYPWQQCTARIVKVQDYEVMVHKGLGSDKVVCGIESGDFRSTETSLTHNCKTPEYVFSDFIDLGITKFSFSRRKLLLMCFQYVQTRS